MKPWYSFYSLETGLFTGQRYRGRWLKENTPEAAGAIEGVYDGLSQRVDLKTGEVVPYQPPAPDADHVWDDAVNRWVVPEHIAAARSAAHAARVAIEAQERKSVRALRELLLNPSNTDAKVRLAEADTVIAELRGKLANRK